MRIFNELKPLLDLRPLVDLKGLESRKFNDLLSGDGLMNLDISEDESKFYVEATIPGVKKDDINIEIEDNMLKISYERKFKNEQKARNYSRTEIGYGKFNKSILIPENIELGHVKANYDSGMLHIEIPKSRPESKSTHKVKVD